MFDLLFAFAGMLWLLLLMQIGLLTHVLWRITDHVVARGAITKAEWRRFVVGVAVIGFTLALTLAFLQYASGAGNPACVGLVPGNERVRIGMDVLGALLPMVLLLWIWVGRGATYVTRVFGELFVRVRSYSPARIRMTVTSIVVAMFLGLLLIDDRPAALVKACHTLQNTPSEMELWRAIERLRSTEL